MIHRLNLPVAEYQEINFGRVISAAPCRSGRSDVVDIWFEAASAFDDKQGLYIFGTGHPTPWNGFTRYAWEFIDTVVTPSGLIWHVYAGPLKGEWIPS